MYVCEAFVEVELKTTTLCLENLYPCVCTAGGFPSEIVSGDNLWAVEC